MDSKFSVATVSTEMVFKLLQKILSVNSAALGLSGSEAGFSFGIISSQILIWYLFEHLLQL